jgi:glutathione S-transferase
MTSEYTLYYAPSACSISPQIALREAGLPFKLERVDLRAKKLASGGDWLAINPKGYVPALRLPSGDVLTEGAIMVQYIADQAPASGLAPPAGTLERLRLAEWLHFIATELHKGMSPLYNPLANDDYKKQLTGERLAARWSILANHLRDRPFIMGERFTVADGYAFYVLRAWQHSAKQDLAKWPELGAYYTRLAARPAIAAALEAEGIKA